MTLSCCQRRPQVIRLDNYSVILLKDVHDRQIRCDDHVHPPAIDPRPLEQRQHLTRLQGCEQVTDEFVVAAGVLPDA